MNIIITLILLLVVPAAGYALRVITKEEIKQYNIMFYLVLNTLIPTNFFLILYFLNLNIIIDGILTLILTLLYYVYNKKIKKNIAIVTYIISTTYLFFYFNEMILTNTILIGFLILSTLNIKEYNKSNKDSKS